MFKSCLIEKIGYIINKFKDSKTHTVQLKIIELLKMIPISHIFILLVCPIIEKDRDKIDK